jgi:hypothetical protein
LVLVVLLRLLVTCPRGRAAAALAGARQGLEAARWWWCGTGGTGGGKGAAGGQHQSRGHLLARLERRVVVVLLLRLLLLHGRGRAGRGQQQPRLAGAHGRQLPLERVAAGAGGCGSTGSSVNVSFIPKHQQLVEHARLDAKVQLMVL